MGNSQETSGWSSASRPKNERRRQSQNSRGDESPVGSRQMGQNFGQSR
jgi:hypothetical protein